MDRTHQIICEKCGRGFTPVTEERKHEGTIIETCIICPKCGHKTTISVTDFKTRRDIAKLRKISKEIAQNFESIRQINDDNAKIIAEASELERSIREKSKQLMDAMVRSDIVIPMSVVDKIEIHPEGKL